MGGESVRWLAGCMGFVWVHADSFLCCVASPFHSFATTLLGSLLPTCPVQGPHRRRLMLTWMRYRSDAWGPGTLTRTHCTHSRRNPGNKPMAVTKIDRGKPQQWLLGHFCWVLLFCWVLIFCLPQQTSYCYCCNHTVQRVAVVPGV